MPTHSELMAIYPWGETKPTQTDFNLADRARFGAGRCVHREGDAARRQRRGARLGRRRRQPLRPTAGAHRRRLPRSAGRRHLPRRRGPTRARRPRRCDDTAIRQGRGRRADLQGQAPALGPHHRVVRRRRLGDRRPRRAPRARRHARPPGRARCGRRSASARRWQRHTRLDLPGDPAARARDRLEQAEPRRLGAGGARPRAARGPTPARATRPPRASSTEARFVGAGFPDYPGCSPPTASSPPSPPSRSASSSRSRSTCGRCGDASKVINRDSGKVVHEVDHRRLGLLRRQRRRRATRTRRPSSRAPWR